MAKKKKKKVKDDSFRPDKTKKGTGFFGVLKRPGGGVSTELSITAGVNTKKKKDVLIPTLVKGSTARERKQLLKGGFLPRQIVGKAIRSAEERISKGKSPFIEKGEKVISPKERMEADTIEKNRAAFRRRLKKRKK